MAFEYHLTLWRIGAALRMDSNNNVHISLISGNCLVNTPDQ